MNIAHSTRRNNKIYKRQLFAEFIILILTADGLNISYNDMKITLSRILSVLFAIMLLTWSIYHRKVRAGGRAGAILFGWLALSLIIDTYYASTLPTLHHWLNLAIGVIWFYAIVNLRPDWRVVQSAVLRVGTLLGILSVFALLSRAASFNPFGVTDYLVPKVVHLYRIVLFSWEPNIFGTIMALSLILTLPAIQSSIKRNALPWSLMLVALIGSLSKGPWVAFLFGLSVYAILSATKKIALVYTTILSVTIVSALALMTARPTLLDSSVIRSENVVVRVVQDQHAFLDILKRPIFGSGTFSFGDIWPYLNFRFGASRENAAWISQAALGVLHDSGLIGLGLMLLFWGSLMVQGIVGVRAAKRSGDTELFRFMSATFAALCVLLVQDWVTTLYALPIYWAFMGIVALIPRWCTTYNCKLSGIDGISGAVSK